jgi:hypothetical protein
MLKSRMKRQAMQAARAATSLAQIEASIAVLKDEDLLDLADIFAREVASPLKAMAFAEMTKRSLRL